MMRLAQVVKGRFLRFRREMITVIYAVRHPATPWRLKLAGVLLLLYLASPIDLIPVVIPVLGVVDDLILVPWGLAQVVKRLPPPARVEAEERAARFIARWVRRPLLFLAGLVLVLMAAWGLVLYLMWRVLAG